ncbi:hypothetical protein ACFWVM_28845 [Nocardia fluminea]|uniref:hypothetical protein n=1 Tax=Nocardia fluminea TaxID=134984 RepID=UPI00365EE8F8
MTATPTELAGRPITGDVTHYADAPVEQHPIAALIELLDSLLALPGTGAVRWEQFTPYFNDGDACTFSVAEPSLRVSPPTSDDADPKTSTEPDNSDEDEVEGDFIDLWSLQYYNDPDRHDEEGWTPRYPEATAEIVDALEKFSNALQSGAYDTDLHTHFGDPAQVTATVEGFTVEHYEHD